MVQSKRGRPQHLYKIFGNTSLCVIYDGGAQERTRRTQNDLQYSVEALRVLKDEEIPYSEEIYNDETGYMCPSILAQLGRMILSDGCSPSFVIKVTKGICILKHRGMTVKNIEKALRSARQTKNWVLSPVFSVSEGFQSSVVT
jgi:hypothetical protein